jgi:hypothetical protein
MGVNGSVTGATLTSGQAGGTDRSPFPRDMKKRRIDGIQQRE